MEDPKEVSQDGDHLVSSNSCISRSTLDDDMHSVNLTDSHSDRWPWIRIGQRARKIIVRDRLTILFPSPVHLTI